ncbi:PucR family transcriptional regulator [Mycobacterium sp. CBMA293]|uniref:PucR family transcriptional regulator n=1 Tax=unclassified Mycolicibacterium TaxID=2636767 RepID=UPI0012DD94EE|nr:MULTISPECIES: helix-turn-helix domain-containing protein [unclassified Mycolicibacterium]MUL47192.1 PucR family transcriptional regulator [Mycolicibacterium sp. CBMA 360]MUL61301.1 PucR family transcriptional regulator [Mycolicibacterium sp. CBMA 335]MUL72036.1 PucR family transcriptional regulator [Mycolicibacterium sp. CBMA 311]MUL96203.1 PucR family transcriptional regulator [Mycolicibacterium sp. CBMA 230]MUM08973.1 transcriptional regulator [Mycolicibacterium sp. CBMA 213]
MPDPAPRYTGLELGEDVTSALQSVLARTAERTVAAVTVEVPSYTDAFSGPMGQNIETAVQMALGGFLRLATRAEHADVGTQLSPALDGAYELGRGEARSGRTIDALLAAYRVGARVAWRELASTAVSAGLTAETMARFAELVFAFIDELSASSVTGHADELATTGRVRERYLERLGHSLLAGEPIEILEASAEQADWAPPTSLTAVLLPVSQVHGLAVNFGPSTLQLNQDLPGVDPTDSLTALLIPDMDGPHRRRLLRALAGRRAWVGPARPWTQVRSSYRRALTARDIVPDNDIDLLDTDEHLVELVIGADREAADDLRRRVLMPLADLRPNTAAALTVTLRSWLLHQGRRDAVAADLVVHAQTVRYRMTQLRELYGERLTDPRTILELTVALGIESSVKACVT